MRNQLGLPELTPNVTRFLIIIIATYLFFALFGRTMWGIDSYNLLLLSPYRAVYSFELWRIFSYAFLHDISSPLHVIFNSLLLYLIGTQLEDRVGEKRFLIFSVVAILMGGIFVCLSFLLGLSQAPVVGFSSVTIALVIAWGVTFSTHRIYVFGLLPLTGEQLVYVTIGLEVLYAVSSSGISSAAHFGGIVTGLIFSLGLYKPKNLKQLWRKLSKRRFK